MKTKTIIQIIITALIISVPAFASTGRAISLNALAASMKSGGSADAQRLCGVTKVLGYLIDAKSHDVVLVGKVDPELPPLYLDDLAVALRSAWMTYIKVENGVRCHYAPGCSIDPDPKVLQQLKELEVPKFDSADSESLKGFSESWKTIGAQPQSVRVMGAPFDSRFSKVMVDADYYMKRIVNGSVALGIDGLESLTDMHTSQMKQSLSSGKDDRAPGMTLNRFWFSPGETTYEVKDGISILRSCPIRLLTEEEFLNEHGAIAGKGRPDPMAGEFARMFTAKYQEIAQARPIYHKLQGLFRFVALAKMMKADRADSVAPSGLGYLLKYQKVKNVPVSRGVNGLTDVRISKDSYDASDGSTRTFSMIQTTCGGVSMDVHPKRIRSTPARKAPLAVAAPAPPKDETASETKVTAKAAKPSSKARLAARPTPRPSLKHVVLSTRKSAKTVAWDFSLSDIDE
ncbi:MAG: DUF1598 domain-containing protein [Armatimonadetes bacterium]|nr:DUF1598 domain-containing protein [Armatimonadota bacterium]